ncbi:MAG: hypothetical protein IPJ79_18325 [Bacteroidetes bacterium]|nr:hypothetical protein [Bacteroidota bacterium]
MKQKKTLKSLGNGFVWRLPMAFIIFLSATFFCNAQTARDTLVANKIGKLQKVFQNYQQLTTSKIQQGYLENAKKVFSNAQPSATDAPYQNAVKRLSWKNSGAMQEWSLTVTICKISRQEQAMRILYTANAYRQA